MGARRGVASRISAFVLAPFAGARANLLEWSCIPGRRALKRMGHDRRSDPAPRLDYELPPESVRSLG